MKNRKIKSVLNCIVDIAIALAVFFAVRCFCIGGMLFDGHEVTGALSFRMFTIDSNILCALVCLTAFPYHIKTARGSIEAPPQWLGIARFVAAVSVGLTMLVVLSFLGPIQGYGFMLGRANLFLHLICPVLALAAFLLLDEGRIEKGKNLWCIAPSLAYGLVYLVQVVIRTAWPDFYGFNKGGLWYVSLIGLNAITYFAGHGLRKLHNKLNG